MARFCMMQFSDGTECQEDAKANISNFWYCAEHYDWWIAYYRRRLLGGDEDRTPNKFDDAGFEETRRAMK